MNIIGIRVFLAGLLVGLLSAAGLAADGREFVIGVQTVRNHAQTMAAWRSTAQYLASAIPGQRFRIEALDTSQLNDAVKNRRIDFVLTNPSHYVFLEESYGISRIATLVKLWDGHPIKEFGGVIVTRADNENVHDISDLRRKRIAAVNLEWLGAYQSQAVEALAAGIDVRRDAEVYFTGEPQDLAVFDVEKGRADVAFVRTGLLEEMQKEGRINLMDFRVINRKEVAHFPPLLSTRLYPEWPISAMPHTPHAVANHVAIALLNLPSRSEAAISGGYFGWSIPHEYRSVHDMMKTLGLPPYDIKNEFSFRDVLQRYATILFAGMAAALMLALLLVARFRWLNKTVTDQVKLVTERTRELEHEIVGRLQAEQGLRLSASVFEHSYDGIVITDRDNRIVDVNQSFSQITGYTKAEVLGKNPSLLKSGRQDKAFYKNLWRTVKESGHWQGEVWNRRKGGEFYVELLAITAVTNEEGVLTHYVGIFSDITALRASQEKLEHLAHFDPLTHLPNRTLLSDRLTQSVALARRDNHLLAVCFVDLDGFKPINDEYGHQTGDQLLINVARRLEGALRAIDTVSRLGGDEFVLLLTRLNDMNELEIALNRVMSAICDPYVIDEIEFRVTASIGVTLFPLDEADPESLIRHADQAMYQAKRAGRNRHCLFDAMQEREDASRFHKLESVRQALEKREFVLFYQPKVDMRQGRVIGVEALIRWNHPERGIVPPGEFLPMIEQSEFMADIDEWVIGEALEQIALWKRRGLDMRVSVNVSARLLLAPDFPDVVRNHLRRQPEVPPGLLEFEVLESAALDDMGRVRQAISRCQELGVTFSLDDFGTGYSSLSYLRRLPVDTVKIDQSFIRDFLENSEDLAIVEGIVGLAKVFQRQVIGEGVESSEHGVMLMRLGCDIAQGYGIARPMPASDVAGWCANFKADPQWTKWADIAWNYEDFPLLIAQSDHVRWVKRIARFVEGGASTIGEEDISDHHRCRFGRWYYGAGMERYGQETGYREIEAIHAEIHRLGMEIVRLVETKQLEFARKRLEDLYALKGRVLDRLESLQLAVMVHVR